MIARSGRWRVAKKYRVHFTWRFYSADRRTKSTIAGPQAKSSLSSFPSV
jgi:hypothetical protein